MAIVGLWGERGDKQRKVTIGRVFCGVEYIWDGFVEYVTFLKILSAPLGLFSNSVPNTRNRENVFRLHKQSINLVKLITDAIMQKVVITYKSRHIL